MRGGGIVTEFEEVYNRYFNDVFLFMCRLSKNEDIAAEVTSETFFKAMKSIKNFKGNCDIKVWLWQIAKNTYFSHLEKRKKLITEDDIELALIADSAPNAEEQIIAQEELLQIQKVLHELPEAYKEVFMWRVFANLSFKQIGAIFHKTDNWACVTYHRARSMIRKRMEDEENEKWM